MAGEIVSHRLDLAVRLTHALTGDPVTDDRAMFCRNGKKLILRLSGGTDWIGVDTGRQNFVLGVNVRGFEKVFVPVRYERMDLTMPMLEIPLIPEQTEWNQSFFVTLEGNLDHLEELQAVPLKGGDLHIISYQEEERSVFLYNPHKNILRFSTYAVVNQKTLEFEIVTVTKAMPDGSCHLAQGLKKSIDGRSYFSRLVYGSVSNEGKYRIRIPRSGDEEEWILRYVVNGKEYFQTTDLKEPVSFTVNKRKSAGKRG